MTPIEKIRKDFQALQAKLEGLGKQREAIDAQMRDVRGEMGELEAALRVIQRYEEPSFLIETNVPLPAKMPTIEEMMVWALTRSPGGRIAALIETAENHFNAEINRKSAGNALWHIKDRGDARREGQRWYPIIKQKAPSHTESGA